MAGFKSSDYGTVQYDFRPDSTIQGTIPDPSDELIQQFFKEFNEFLKENGLDDAPNEYELRSDPEKLQKELERIRSIDKVAIHHQQLKIIAKLCQDQPSVEDMMTLPYRKRIRFVQFVMRELTNPEV